LPNESSGKQPENIMSHYAEFYGRRRAVIAEPQSKFRPLLIFAACPAAAAWFGLCCLATGKFGVFGRVLLARPSLYFGLLLLLVTVVAFGMLPRPHARRDRYALALSLAMSAFTVVSFAVASQLAGV
jgi:hypothetical protein